MKLKTIVIVGTGVAAGMVVANYLTKGAVMDAVSDVAGNVKDRFFSGASKVIEVGNDVADDVVEVTENIAESL